MPNNSNIAKSKLKGAFTLIGTVIVVVLLLVYFLPRETKFGYEYEQGRPWRYNSLIATFDFPVYKTPDEVKAERDSALSQFQPFYTEDVQIAQRQIAAFETAWRAGRFGDVPAHCLNHVDKMLRGVYEAGMVPSADLSQMAKERTPGVRVVEGTEAVTRPITELYSTRSAYEYIVYADTINFPRELLARCNINEYLSPNLSIDSAKTSAVREDLLAAVSPASGMVQSGQRIIDRGEIISAEQYKILQSFERETVRRNDPSKGMWQVVTGQVIFVLCVIVAFVFYLRLFRREYLRSPHSILLLSSLIAIFPLITYAMVDQKFLNVYMVPYAMVPIFVRIFMDSRTAFMTMVCSVILSSLALHSNYEFVIVQFMSGMTAIYALRDLTERSQLLRVALAVFVTSSAIMLGYDLSQGIEFSHLDRSMYVYNAVNGVLLLFAYPLLYMIEKLFGFTSSVTLVELSNTNNSVLRRMSKVAQGTFVHSLQVANLAAEVADKIGAKPQLVRTGALYHDIGKMLNPAFFTENQTGVNPHDELTEERSAQIIISHVTEGLKLADKYHLPKVIRDFISTHHGRSQVKYFYIQWKNKHQGEEPDAKLFTYPGPNPFTREQAILMMCDAVEASSRSLKEFTEESIKELVNRIIDGQVQAGYFRECPITFRDIADAKRVLAESLKTIYHTRIAYPELNAKPAEPAPQPRRTYFFGRR
ncbi:HD family phosphohydrolase [Prevotellamassilia timonensis]|jgi:putative nucleotidyltransferase with HDIG domain|uniref:HD family phosphohydrolase n=1 Tax=Prevotellamassilia timonensis TaxID=1852370 RepID=UPI0025994E3C|nr:HDIG domain-containing metalloprotein [uncultured Prevotellamassilia sp.]